MGRIPNLAPQKTLALRLDEDLHVKVQALAAIVGCTLADAIRQALSEWVERTENDANVRSRRDQAIADLDAEYAKRRQALQGV